MLLLRRSKTDRKNVGQVTFDWDSFPAHFLKVYFQRFGFQAYKAKDEFFVFMSMRLNKLGQCLMFRDPKMSFNSCTRVLKSLYKKAGINGKDLSSHSLRIRGLLRLAGWGSRRETLRKGPWVGKRFHFYGFCLPV